MVNLAVTVLFGLAAACLVGYVIGGARAVKSLTLKPIDHTPGKFRIGSLVQHRADAAVGVVVDYEDGEPVVAFGAVVEDYVCHEIELVSAESK